MLGKSLESEPLFSASTMPQQMFCNSIVGQGEKGLVSLPVE